MRFNFVMVSGNAKTGPMPVTSTSKDSCPDSCPLKNNGCYASAGRLNILWTRLNDRGLTFRQLIKSIASIPLGRIWRHNQAGDLPGKNERIDAGALRAIVDANRGRRGFTYTHKPMTRENRRLVKEANAGGFTINLSADNLEEADALASLNVAPVVTVLNSDARENLATPAGRKVVICPAYTHNVQCVDCGLCQHAKRSVIVGFPAHGPSFKRVNDVVKGGAQ